MSVEVITRLSPAQIDDLLALYAREWRTQGRTRAAVERMLAASDVVVALCEADTRRLVGFSRVLTDYVYKAILFDVIVAPPARGRGLGRRLLDAVLAHPALAGVRHFELYCRTDVIPFYARWGFRDTTGELHFLRWEASGREAP
jgi:GNAT superfamily N-acetyltransferase